MTNPAGELYNNMRNKKAITYSWIFSFVGKPFVQIILAIRLIKVIMMGSILIENFPIFNKPSGEPKLLIKKKLELLNTSKLDKK